MQITSLTQFADYLLTGFQHGWGNIKLYHASAKFQSITPIEGLACEPIIATSLHDVQRGDMSEHTRFFHYRTADREHWSSFSLVDANVIPNTYHDWRVFTTLEEAEEYSNPQAAFRKRIGAKVGSIDIFDNGILIIAIHNKIEAIKTLRTITHSGLGEAKQYVENLLRANANKREGMSLGDILTEALNNR